MKSKLPPIPWEKLEGLQKTHKLGILIGTYIVVLGAMFYFLIMPASSSITLLNEQIEEATEKIAFNNSGRMRRKIADAPENLKRLQSELEISREFLPEKHQVDQLLKSVSARARIVGLHVIQFRPLPEPKELKGEFLAEVPFVITVEGPYINIAQFLYEVSRLPRIIRIDSIRLADPRLRWYDPKTQKGHDEKSETSLNLGYDQDEAAKTTRTVVEDQLVLTAAITGTTYRFVETSLPSDELVDEKSH